MDLSGSSAMTGLANLTSNEPIEQLADITIAARMGYAFLFFFTCRLPRSQPFTPSKFDFPALWG